MNHFDAHLSPCLPSGELSDEYQTDYDEEVVESAASDYEG